MSNLSQYNKETLKRPLQRALMLSDLGRISLSGNPGIAVIKARQIAERSNDQRSRELTERLNEIYQRASNETRVALSDYFNLDAYAPSENEGIAFVKLRGKLLTDSKGQYRLEFLGDDNPTGRYRVYEGTGPDDYNTFESLARVESYYYREGFKMPE